VNTLLGVETSCDECSVSVCRYEPNRLIHVAGLATFSQIAIHQPYGGVVPEIASRNHLETINAMVTQALEQAAISLNQIDAIAVTNRPGLVGALLVGVSAAKAIAYATGKPLLPIHHLEGHAASVMLSAEPGQPRPEWPYPMLIAIVSGRHPNLYLPKTPHELWPPDYLKKCLIGRSRDDAAGEAFDKTAKTLGFPYPGGAYIEKAAKQGGGNPQAFAFPRALPSKQTYDFSFSGLKTAVALEAEKLKKAGTLDARISDLCASIQEAIVDALLTKVSLAVREHHCRSLALVGGVAANGRLRARLDASWKEIGLEIPPIFPDLRYCTDNAAMIAAAGAFRYQQGHHLRSPEFLTLNALASADF